MWVHGDMGSMGICCRSSVYSPRDLFQGESTGGLFSDIRHQGATVEDQYGHAGTVSSDGHDPFVCYIETVT